MKPLILILCAFNILLTSSCDPLGFEFDGPIDFSCENDTGNPNLEILREWRYTTDEGHRSDNVGCINDNIDLDDGSISLTLTNSNYLLEYDFVANNVNYQLSEVGVFKVRFEQKVNFEATLVQQYRGTLILQSSNDTTEYNIELYNLPICAPNENDILQIVSFTANTNTIGDICLAKTPQ